MQVFDHLNPGDRATWETFNGIVKGTVESVGPRGVLVRIDGGGNMILSTTTSYRNFIERKILLPTIEPTRTAEQVEALR